MVDATMKADCIAEEMRKHYEANRESWWERYRNPRPSSNADNLMLGLLGVVHREEENWKKIEKETNK